LVGDRGFRGADRMAFLQRELGWDYVLRISSETMIQLKAVPGQWLPLSHLTPALGGGWEHADVLCGRTTRKQAGRGARVKVFANLVAVRQPLLLPRRRRNNKGRPTGELLEETTWFLATSLPLGTGGVDVVELYQRRMQIEQTFRDFKSLWGMEREYTRQPNTRLEALLWAVTCGMALDLQAAPAVPQASPPKRCRKEGSASAGEPLRYPRESATRTGMHQLLIRTLLQHGALWEALQEVATISTRMQARPQVAFRRRDTPALRNRSRTLHAPSPP
jgi:hypothetical protein